ncbi:MAG: FAD-binding oxidoreductase [Rhodospirillaceae bacterium]|nr:FAD-binding oxidoreductase [Rhodospirillaceae bacterium]
MTSSTFFSALVEIVGKGYVFDKKSDKSKYLTDWPNKITGKARAVVFPANTEDVSKIMRLCFDNGVPVIPQGGNTGLSGAATPDLSGRAIILSLARLNTIFEVNGFSQTMMVGAGCILADIHQAAEANDLFFPLHLGAQGSCEIGGNLATNAGGINVLRYGNARELCLGIEVVLPDGRIMDLLSALRKDNTGYDLRDLFIGSEGTLGIITAAMLKLFPLPKARASAFVAVPNIDKALMLLNHIQSETGGAVEAFELVPRIMMQLLAKHLPNLKQPFADPPVMSVLIELAASSGHCHVWTAPFLQDKNELR